MSRRLASSSRRRKRNTTVIYVLLIIVSVLSFFPILWMVLTSIKIPQQMYSSPPRLLPSIVTTSHYQEVLENPLMLRYFLNSAIVSSISTLASIFTGMLAAYGFSRFRFRLKQPLYVFVLGSKMLPVMVLVIPLYIIFIRLKLVDNRLGLIIAYMALTLPLAVWLFRGFMERLPRELDHAAMIDGCSSFQTLRLVIVPLMRPAILAVAMYVFLLTWNDFLFALIITVSESVRTISIGMTFYMEELFVNWGALMATSTLMTLPPMIIYILFHKHLTLGLSEGAVKT
ncbi:MAG: carbohydrate ABC transporter permease [Spirochaetaceae bacterium]|nr:MAG: carbohydrate ABC transporter permease [Spirochaetaceae bacterium]